MRPPPGPHLPLRLDDLIPPPVCTHVDFQPVLALRELLLIAPLGMAKSRQNVVKWHAATQDAFLITPDWAGEQPLCFSFCRRMVHLRSCARMSCGLCCGPDCPHS